MENKIFLETMRSKQSRNTSPGIHVDLKGNSKLLPLNDVSSVISQMEQYAEEREKCRKIRLTCQVNPVCTNVLFNRITEIVKYEGSSGVTMLNYGISGDTNPFLNDQVTYKPNNIEFWSGGTMAYQGIDESVSRLAASTPLNNLNDEIRADIKGNSSVTQAEKHPTNAIRDTQLSKNDTKGDHFVYHCGLDILNNHLIRSNTFKCICKMPATWDDRKSGWEWPSTDKNYTAFNTIADVMREANGNKVVEKIYFPVSAGVDGGAKLLGLHMYLFDDILSFKDSVKNRLIDKYNGWLGFLNKSKIKSYQDFVNNTDMKMERPIMYMNGGDYVDMYPGRDLYSFVPKYNKYKNRMEKNWNYCITYPSSSTTEGFDDIIEPSNASMRTIYFDENTMADSGSRQLVMYSRAKHGLSVGDRVNIYKNYETTIYYVINTETGNIVSEMFEDELDMIANLELMNTLYSDVGFESGKTVSTVNHVMVSNAKVDEVVDEYIFTTFTQDSQISDTWIELKLDDYLSGFTTSAYNESTSSYTVSHFSASTDGSKYFYDDDFNKYYIVNDKYINVDKTAQNITYKKTVGDIECDYYVRIFSRLPNFRFASGDTNTEYSIYNKPDGGESLVDIYQSPEYDFESHTSRLAFAKNIYSDDIGEIVFTDDICFDNLRDNLGRPLTDLYFTAVKNNAGYKEWYGFDDMPITISADTIEFSHCFGKVTCGMEMSDESAIDKTTNSIKLINNINTLNSGYLVDSINMERYSAANSADTIERHIMPQEVDFSHDKRFYGDLCYYDNYNAVERVIQPVLHRFNTGQRESSMAASKDYFSTLVYDEITRDDYDTGDDYVIKQYRMGDCNVKPEGYYYIPHYRIPVRSFGTLNTMMPQFLAMQSIANNGESTRIVTQQYHFLTPGDKAMIYDMVNDKYYRLETIPGDGDNSKAFTCKITTEDGKPTMDVDGNKINNYKLFKLDNMEAPSYAHLLKDGTCRYIWRNVVNNGSSGGDRNIEEYPFTNGAFYVNRKIDIYLRRQDPYDNYGLYGEDDIDMIGVQPKVEEINNYYNEEDIEC